MDHLEKMLKMNSYDGPGSRTTEKPMKFKFQIGDKVQHLSFGYNAVIMRRITTEDADSTHNSYDLGLWGAMPPIEDRDVPEIYLKAGHRVE